MASQQKGREARRVVIFFSGPLTNITVDRYIETILPYKERGELGIVLSTFGGDPDAAYRMARVSKKYFGGYTLYVFGYCKSAGTLLALGANEIVMSPLGELGPLDVQLLKEDDLMYRQSGLDLTHGLINLSMNAYEYFEVVFLDILRKSGGSITTKTAAHISTELVKSLYGNVFAQIDPLRVGAVGRANRIGKEYALRLSQDKEAIERLINSYPSHTFVIDYEEAKELLKHTKIREIDNSDNDIVDLYTSYIPRYPIEIEDKAIIIEKDKLLNIKKDSSTGSDGNGIVNSDGVGIDAASVDGEVQDGGAPEGQDHSRSKRRSRAQNRKK